MMSQSTTAIGCSLGREENQKNVELAGNLKGRPNHQM